MESYHSELGYYQYQKCTRQLTTQNRIKQGMCPAIMKTDLGSAWSRVLCRFNIQRNQEGDEAQTFLVLGQMIHNLMVYFIVFMVHKKVNAV
jgi:hypothetical protein